MNRLYQQRVLCVQFYTDTQLHSNYDMYIQLTHCTVCNGCCRLVYSMCVMLVVLFFVVFCCFMQINERVHLTPLRPQLCILLLTV